MSANMFSTNPDYQTSKSQPETPHSPQSRIPLPSPTPLRRSGSLRTSRERFSFDTNQTHRSYIRDASPSFAKLNDEPHAFPVHGEHATSRTQNARLATNQNFPTGKPPHCGRPPQLGVTHFGAAPHSGAAPNSGAAPHSRPPPLLLRRGYSMLEKSTLEKRDSRDGLINGGAKSSAVANRPRLLNIEGRNKGPRPGPPTPGQVRKERNKSLSLSISNSYLNSPNSPSIVTSSPRTPLTSPDRRHLSVSVSDWDTESIASGISGISLASSCDHVSVARNGTTFSGRSMKYVVHCNQHAGATGEDYLTPTQRAHKQVKRLKQLLFQAQKDLEQKDSDIVKLTKEVVELRLYKAALSSPEDKSNSSDAVTVRENNVDTEHTTPIERDLPDGVAIPNHLGMISSCTDSGHFEDFTNSSVHSKDSVHLSEDFSQSPIRKKVETADKFSSVDLGPRDHDGAHDKLANEYELRIQELVKEHENESHLMKQKHNDKIEELLLRISEINERYWQLVPDLEAARERIKELELNLEEASRKLEEQEDKHKQMYLQMYNQGQRAAKLENEKQVMDLAGHSPNRVSVPELLNQLQVTQAELENVRDLEYASSSNNPTPLLSAKEAISLWVLGARKAMYKQLMEARSKSKIDPEITLQFLKSAVYYFLTDRENNQGHLRAIQSILGFSENEIKSIDAARLS